jgi:exodeoxyribonuclease V gamma subunit
MLVRRQWRERSTVSFNLFYGNDAEALLERLVERLCVPSAQANLLVPEVVLVPQFGLRRWLEIRLAERCGILANVDFFAPAEYAWKLLRAENPQLREDSLFERKLLRWRIFAELGDLSFDPRFPALRRALADGQQSSRLHLADEVAQVFERYLAYRSDLLARWEKREARDDWQAELWRRLTGPEIESHRATLLGDYIGKHDAKPTKPGGVPVRLFAFACTNVSPDLLRFYDVVAQHCEFDFFLPNPCREYWGDVRAEKERLRERNALPDDHDENPLLAGYGRAGRDFVNQLFSYDQVRPTQEDDLSIERGRGNLLRCVQTDILERSAPTRIGAVPEKDTSIQFHICHSRLREVQVLHDQLLDLFQKDPTLTPRDVAIMAPDVATYAPYIHAVFGAIPRDSTRHLPYTLSDCSARDAHPLIAFALKLAALPTSRFGLNEFVELFSEAAVLRKLDLDAGELDQLASWLREAGVRWGIDEAQHAAFGAGDYREFSWDFGLDRLLLGYASGAADELIDGISPLPAIEGSSAQMLGALLRGWEALKQLLREQRSTHTPAQWQQIYNAALDLLLAIDHDDRVETQALESIRSALAALAEDAAAAGVDEPLDWQSVRDFLNERLGEPERSYRFFAGGISVCGMLPLRVVPFRVICLIGMNDEVFPRRDRASALTRAHSATAADGARVDRSNRDDDRYLFLQLLTSVRDVFYLSWIGEEQRDGMAREPSAVIAELLDVLCKSYLPDAKQAYQQLVVKHPLQPFSPRHFDGLDRRVFTYRRQWRNAAAGASGAQALEAFVDAVLDAKDANGLDDAAIELDELQQFWRNPARAFFSDRLNLRLPRQEDDGEDADPLELDGLLRHRLVDALIQTNLSTPAPERDDARILRAQALLPVGFGGAATLAAARLPAREIARALRAGFDEMSAAATQPFSLGLPSGACLVGTLPQHRDGLICRYSTGAIRGSRLLAAWLDLLVLTTQREGASLLMLGWEKGALQEIRLHGIERKLATAQLDRLLRWHAAGQRRPLLFFPKAAQTYALRWRKSLAANSTSADVANNLDGDLSPPIDAAALDFARKTFAGTAFGASGGVESADAAYALATRGLDPFDPETSAAEDFAHCAIDVYAALLAALDESA